MASRSTSSAPSSASQPTTVSDAESPSCDYTTDCEVSGSASGAPPRRKARVLHSRTRFNSDWTKKHPSIVKVSGDDGKAYCTACRKGFMVCHQGYRDVVRHMKSSTHRSTSRVIVQSGKITDSFLSEKQDISTKVIAAEVKFTAFFLEHNLPIATADHAGPLFRSMFPDSKIASYYASGRTKTTSIINGALAPNFSSSVVKVSHLLSLSTGAMIRKSKSLYH